MFKPVLIALGLAASLSLAAPALGDDEPRLVKLVPVGQGDITLRRNFFGRVAARETVDIAFQVPGQVALHAFIQGRVGLHERVGLVLDRLSHKR